jgi:hypothetical protein
MRQPRLRTVLVASGAAIALVAGTTTAYAAAAGPVDGSGVIHGCYTSKALGGSHVIVLQDASTNCPAGTTAISWNQQGPSGAAGPQGPAGPTGATGSQGSAGPQGPQGPKGDTGAAGAAGTGATVATLASGDPNCGTGGASVTDGNGNTAYACNGAAGPTGPQGLQGPSGSSGVQIDAGWLQIVQLSSGSYECIGSAVGPDAGSVQFNAIANGYDPSEETCVVSGFPSLTIPVSVDPGGYQAATPQPIVFFSQPGLVECPGSYTGTGGCLLITAPASAFQQSTIATYFWEAEQTPPSAATNAAAAKREQQAVRRMAALARPHHG